MISYKDKTFCPFERCNKFSACPDALTKEVKRRAIAWGGRNAPISKYMNSPECFEGKR